MSGRTQPRTTPPLMSMEEANQRFDQVVHDAVYELLDLDGLLELEQDLWQALFEAGVPRAEAPRFSAQLIARALTRIGEEHVKLEARTSEPGPAPTSRFKA